jgi:hypothetical protein
MTSQSPRIYIYKITFEEVPYYYYGVHKETKFGEEYWGSPKTNKWCWELYTPKKQILQLFDFTDEGWIEAQEVEKRIIKPIYNTDKWCLNENCGGKVSLETSRKSGKKSGKKTRELGLGIHGLTTEQRIENGKNSALKNKENKTGIFGMTPEEKSDMCKKGGKIGGQKTYELGLGFHGRTKEQMTEDGKRGGKKTKELGIGFYGRTKEQITKDSIKGGKKTKELGVGVHGRTKEQMTEDGKKGGKIGGKIGSKKTNAQKWKCTETGYVTTSGPLTRYQKAKGIDTSKRVRIL